MQKVAAMKTATMPPLRVTESLRGDAESVLREGETLSAFIEESLKTNITRRRVQSEFIARGLRSRDAARRTGDYTDATVVLRKLDSMLAAKKRKATVKG